MLITLTCRGFEQVAHRARPAAEKLAEQRVDAGEQALAGSLVYAEGEAGHDLLRALGDLLCDLLFLVNDDAGGLNRATDVMLAGKLAVVCGYGDVGKGAVK